MMVFKDALAKTLMLIGLSDGNRIPQRRPIWVVSGNARYGLFDPFYPH